MWKAAQATVRGRGHALSNIPCQDKTHVLKVSDVLAVALADGAGSAAHSELGAECVTRTCCQLLTDNFDRYFGSNDAAVVAVEMLDALRMELSSIASEVNCEVRELASTLLAVAVRDGRFIAVHLGDGVIGCLNGDELHVLSRPDNGEFINETTFVTSLDAIAHLRLSKGELDNISAFVLMSDGTAAGFYQRRTHTLIPAIKRLVHATKLMAIDEVETALVENIQETLCKVTTDDCSLILMVEGNDEVDESASPIS